jgi:serine/threonine protein kinase
MGDGVPPNAEVPLFRAMRMTTNPAVPSPTFREPDEWSADIKDFVAKCLQKDPTVRPSAAELITHPFLQQQPTPDVLRSAMMNALEIKKKQNIEKENEAQQAQQLVAESPKRAQSPETEKKRANAAAQQAPPAGASSPARTRPGKFGRSESGKQLQPQEDSDQFGTMVVNDKPSPKVAEVQEGGVDAAAYGTMFINDDDGGDAFGTMVVRDPPSKPSSSKLPVPDDAYGTMFVKDGDEDDEIDWHGSGKKIVFDTEQEDPADADERELMDLAAGGMGTIIVKEKDPTGTLKRKERSRPGLHGGLFDGPPSPTKSFTPNTSPTKKQPTESETEVVDLNAPLADSPASNSSQSSKRSLRNKQVHAPDLEMATILAQIEEKNRFLEDRVKSLEAEVAQLRKENDSLKKK